MRKVVGVLGLLGVMASTTVSGMDALEVPNGLGGISGNIFLRLDELINRCKVVVKVEKYPDDDEHKEITEKLSKKIDNDHWFAIEKIDERLSYLFREVANLHRTSTSLKLYSLTDNTNLHRKKTPTLLAMSQEHLLYRDHVSYKKTYLKDCKEIELLKLIFAVIIQTRPYDRLGRWSREESFDSVIAFDKAITRIRNLDDFIALLEKDVRYAFWTSTLLFAPELYPPIVTALCDLKKVTPFLAKGKVVKFLATGIVTGLVRSPFYSEYERIVPLKCQTVRILLTHYHISRNLISTLMRSLVLDDVDKQPDVERTKILRSTLVGLSRLGGDVNQKNEGLTLLSALSEAMRDRKQNLRLNDGVITDLNSLIPYRGWIGWLKKNLNAQ